MELVSDRRNDEINWFDKTDWMVAGWTATYLYIYIYKFIDEKHCKTFMVDGDVSHEGMKSCIRQ